MIDEEKTAELHFTGVAINLLNLRPEICTLLLIKTDDWIKNHNTMNAEMHDISDKTCLLAIQGPNATKIFQLTKVLKIPLEEVMAS